MRPSLSAHNYAFAKWLNTKLKPLSLNRYEVADIFEFESEIHNLKVANSDILVSNISSLFTNVPLDETIEFLANRVFTTIFFNTTYTLYDPVYTLYDSPKLVDLLYGGFLRTKFRT